MPAAKSGSIPRSVDVFLAEAQAGRLWESLDEPDLARSVSLVEPPDRVLVATPEWLDLTAYAFARIIDAKSPFTYQRSEGIPRVRRSPGGPGLER